MKILFSAVLACLLAAPFLAFAQNSGPPKKPDAPKKLAFDEKADAKAAVQTALAAAKRHNRRVLIYWGNNASPASLQLHDRFKSDSQLARTLLYEYFLVPIDTSINAALPELYGANLTQGGVPALTVLNADGQSLANQSAAPFETKQGDQTAYDAKKLLEFLNAHKAAPLKAEAELTAALTKAEKTNRHVFLHFGAPWCGWCKKLEAWLLRPEIAPMFGKEFVEIEIDIDRMVGGKDVMARYPGSDKGGIPWFAMLDAKGNVLANSNDAKGNIGFPYTDSEIAHFATMLKTSKRHLTDSEIDSLKASLTALAKADSKGG